MIIIRATIIYTFWEKSLCTTMLYSKNTGPREKNRGLEVPLKTFMQPGSAPSKAIPGIA